MPVQANSLANLRPPFERGNTINRVNKGKTNAVAMACRVAPEMLKICIDMARDLAEPPGVRLKAVDIVLKVAFPQKSTIQVTPGSESGATRFLDVVFIHRGENGEVLEGKPNGHDTFTVSFDAE